MVADKVRDYYDKAAKERQKRGVPVSLPEGKGDSRDAAGKAVGVSGSLVDRGMDSQIQQVAILLSGRFVAAATEFLQR